MALGLWGGCLRADWADETGFRSLQARLGALMPNGAGVTASQIEAANGNPYAPVVGSGTVLGPAYFGTIPFTLKSGANAAIGFHASEVAFQFFGQQGFQTRYGFATRLAGVDCYELNDWLEAGGMKLGSNMAPLSEGRDIQNHSWAGSLDTDTQNGELLMRLDWMVRADNVLSFVGTFNDPTAAVPELLTSAYNAISVGMSNGNHAAGSTQNSVGGGRVKPDLVTPLDFSSYACPVASAAGVLLRQEANGISVNAQQHLTLRACLLAGATKEEFPSWDRTTTRPLDEKFGVGELNIDYSHRILRGLEQSRGTVTPAAAQGWDFHTFSSPTSTADYLLEITPALAGAKLSAVLAWDRVISDPIPGPNFSPTAALANLSLTLAKRVGTTTTFNMLDSSDSPVDNVEHIWHTGLPTGQYRLRVATNAAGDFAIAWRLTAVAPPSIGIAQSGAVWQLSLANLVPGQAYTLQASENLMAWADLLNFTATQSGDVRTVNATSASKRFFRLKWL
jgi:hypothetical protein